MIEKSGEITFAQDLIALVDDFLDEYEAEQGGFDSDMDRGLVISYALGVMRCEMEALWDCVGEADCFKGLHPRRVYEDCDKGLVSQEQREVLRQMVREQLWYPQAESAIQEG